MRSLYAAFACIVLTLSTFATGGHAVTLIIDPVTNELTGATGISLQGKHWDVEFLHGSCIEVFSGCDNVGQDFAFNTTAKAGNAAQALLDQVLIDVDPDFFDAHPFRTRGCPSSAGADCRIFIPFRLQSAGTVVRSRVVVNEPLFGGDSILGGTNAFRNDIQVWARFSIPEPATFGLFAAGLAGLGLLRRRRATS